MMDLDRIWLDVNLPLQDIDVDLLTALFIRNFLVGWPLSHPLSKSYWLI